MNRKRVKIPYESFDVGALRLHYFDGSKYQCRKQCDDDPSLNAVKIEYMHNNDDNKSCFFVVGEKKALLSACLRQNAVLNSSTEPHTVEFINCSYSTHEVILEDTNKRSCPVHLYLDLEIKKREIGDMSIPANIDKKLTPIVIRIVLEILKEWINDFNYNMEENVLILTSTREDQYSIHVIFKGIVFPSISVLHAFAKEMKAKTDIIAPFNLYASRIIDFGVYRKEPTLRMFNFGKSLCYNQWDAAKRAPRQGVNTHPLRLMEFCQFPTNVVSMVDKVIYASIGMDSESLKTINVFPRIPLSTKTPIIRATYTEKVQKQSHSMVELDAEGEEILKQMYENLEDMNLYWPRQYLVSAYKNMVSEENIVLNTPLEPRYTFEYVNNDDGIPCFRDPMRFQPRFFGPHSNIPHDCHHRSSISLYVYPNGNVKQSCWPHGEGFKLFFVGNYLPRNNFTLSDSIDVCVKTDEPAILGVNILNLETLQIK